MNTRRDFLKFGGGAAALGMISACQPQTSAPEPAQKGFSMIDFNQGISRLGTDSVKWDGRSAVFGTDDVVPLWVADMDFAAPPAVREALARRAAHPVYGYTQIPERLFTALMTWQKQRHAWEVERDWIAPMPGVVPVLYAAVRAFTQAGEGVIVQPPVYTPFFSAVTDNDRRLILNPLRVQNGEYRMDFEHLEQCAQEGGKLLLLCSPHNPVGRVWRRDELETVLEIARKHDLIIVSDEIHADLVYAPNVHIPLASLEDFPERVITALAPSKTFNIPGLGPGFMLCGEPELRGKIREQFAQLHLETNNPFVLVAAEAAYTQGAPWLDALLAYLQETRDAVALFCKEHLQGVEPFVPQGTFLMWLDFREFMRERHLNEPALQAWLVQKAQAGLSPGTLYGEAGSGYMRLNLGAPRQVVLDALERIRRAAMA